MKQKSFDAVRQKSRALAVLLCLAVLLLTGCGAADLFFSGGTRALRISIGVQFDSRV